MELVIPKVAYKLTSRDLYHLPDNAHHAGTVCGKERNKLILHTAWSRKLIRDLTEKECCPVCFAAFVRPPFNSGADVPGSVVKAFIVSLDAPAYPAKYELGITCPKCKQGSMQAGVAIKQTWGTSWDFHPGDDLRDKNGKTMNIQGPGKLTEVLKCTACGFSVTEPEK